MIHPDGLNSFDMGVWQEDDGSAFLVRSVNNEYVGISPLSPDYSTTTGLVSTAPRVCHRLLLKSKPPARRSQSQGRTEMRSFEPIEALTIW